MNFLQPTEVTSLHQPNTASLQQHNVTPLHQPDVTPLQQPTVTSFQQPNITSFQQPIATSLQQPSIIPPQQPNATLLQQPDIASLQRETALCARIQELEDEILRILCNPSPSRTPSQATTCNFTSASIPYLRRIQTLENENTALKAKLRGQNLQLGGGTATQRKVAQPVMGIQARYMRAQLDLSIQEGHLRALGREIDSLRREKEQLVSAGNDKDARAEALRARMGEMEGLVGELRRYKVAYEGRGMSGGGVLEDCVVCLAREATLAIAVCGHLCFCAGCAKKLVKLECPCCGVVFQSCHLIRIYRP